MFLNGKQGRYKPPAWNRSHGTCLQKAARFRYDRLYVLEGVACDPEPARLQVGRPLRML